MKTVNIMGTEYMLSVDDLNNPTLTNADGVCELYDKEITLRKTEYMSGNSHEARKRRFDHVLRHELVHAIAQECGVPYGENEELVDWIAHIIPMVNKAVEESKDLGE